MKLCNHCHKTFKNDASFCPFCGSKLEDVIEQEVVDTPFEERARQTTDTAEDIERFKQEILSCIGRRTGMIVSGSVMAGLSLVLMILFAVLYMNALRAFYQYPGYGYTGPIGLYVFLIVMCSFIMTGGITLIVVGAVTNSVKIKKRENRIRRYEIEKRRN